MNTESAVIETPFDVFQRAISLGIQPSTWECWLNFVHWEQARNFGDDPSHPAKAAIEWIDVLDEIRSNLDEFEGESIPDCTSALDDAAISFAKLTHSKELVHAIEKWIEYRLNE